MYQKGLGSGVNGEFTFLDILGILSFIVGMMNLDENLTQGDKQDLLQEFSSKADLLLKEIHSHLQEQDDKLDKLLEVNSNDNRRGVQPS